MMPLQPHHVRRELLTHQANGLNGLLDQAMARDSGSLALLLLSQQVSELQQLLIYSEAMAIVMTHR